MHDGFSVGSNVSLQIQYNDKEGTSPRIVVIIEGQAQIATIPQICQKTKS